VAAIAPKLESELFRQSARSPICAETPIFSENKIRQLHQNLEPKMMRLPLAEIQPMAEYSVSGFGAIASRERWAVD